MCYPTSDCIEGIYATNRCPIVLVVPTDTEAQFENAWTDEAVATGEDDTLGRLPYARKAAELIHGTHSFESSAVFGLTGSWGSGKTSLVNMIVEELKAAHPEWAIARFTPWATSDTSGLLGEFYSSLAQSLPKKKLRERARRVLAVTAAVAAPAAALIPLAGSTAAEGVRAIGEALAEAPPWQDAFDAASKELKELGIPILVIVDDIDRLHVDELMALLKVVRLLGRFDGVQYLLAYDDETLYRSMSNSSPVNSNDGSAERFMEKIVQYPLFVPPMLQHQQLTRLNAGLAEVSRGDNGSSDGRLSSLLECVLALLPTPRSIDRYVAQLRHHLPLVPVSEIDDEDVEVLTLVRVAFPSLFNAIPPERNRLLTGHTDEIKVGSGPGSLVHERFDIEPMLAVAPFRQREYARQLLCSLFPAVSPKDGLTAYASSKSQSIHQEEYFDRYFAMGILDHDVSDAEVVAAVAAAAAGNGGDLANLILQATDAELRTRIIVKAATEENHPKDNIGRLHLAPVLAATSNKLPSDDNTPFSERDLIFDWLSLLILRLDKETPWGAVHGIVHVLDKQVPRIRLWSKVERLVGRFYRNEVPAWYVETEKRLADEAATDFFEHLKLGDAAPDGHGIGYQLHFAIRHDLERVRSEVAELVGSGAVHISVLASRITSAVGSSTSKDWRLSPDFEQSTFNMIAPAVDDAWYDEPEQEVDRSDLSWANRRKFAAGHVDRPPITATSETLLDEPD
jgi:hypothetical protein